MTETSGFWRALRGDGTPRARAGAYVSRLTGEPPADDVAWLAAIMLGHDEDHARWELRYAMRAIGLLVAERDALDDRTASLVAEALELALERDPNVAANMVNVAGAQFEARLAAYREAFHKRSARESQESRLARELLSFSSAVPGDRERAIREAAGVIARQAATAAEALRRAFGEARLPDDVKPSEALGG
ncbi:MAG: hypothetical protein HYX65_00315 [Gemmatimonadetes bacterium]|nr:hypothetical protein [Gemmatimonadota bacterium]